MIYKLQQDLNTRTVVTTALVNITISSQLSTTYAISTALAIKPITNAIIQ